MESLGTKRLTFTLNSPPPGVLSVNQRRSSPKSAIIPVFEPYEENLPLQSGYYSFVIDERGALRVKMGNTSSHGAMIGYQRAGAAGNFRINRAGRLAEVFCRSSDYPFRYRDPSDTRIAYITDFFLRHPALNASDHIVFHFRRGLADVLDLDAQGNSLDTAKYQNYLKLLESEGIGSRVDAKFTPEIAAAFRQYRPKTPPRLYPMHKDQLIIAIEEGDEDPFEFGPSLPPYSIEDGLPSPGKNNFVIDAEGRLIIGIKGHHILSGGSPVGGAGHIQIEESGKVSSIQLNFSGHYRPPLSIDYCRYVFHSILEHPLLAMNDGYLVQGRFFDDQTDQSCVIRFDPEDLLIDNEITDEHIERLLI